MLPTQASQSGYWGLQSETELSRRLPFEHQANGIYSSRRYIVQNGQITFTNAEIFDHQAGDGLVTDAWKENPLYSRGTGQTPNTCLDFVYRLLEHMNLDLDPAMNTIFASGDAYYTIASPKNSVSENVPHVWSEKLELPDGYKPPPGVDTWARIFDVLQDPKQPTLMLDSAVVCKTKMAKRQCTNPEQFGEDTWFSDTITEEELDGLLAGTPPDDSSRIPSIAQETRGTVQPFQDAVGTPETAGTDLATIGMGRAAGVVSAVWLVAREVAQGLGQIVGPAFVLLDMVQGNWVGAGLAAVGLALGAAISMAGAGPVGWIVGGIIAALFTILPGAWEKKNIAAIGDRVGILQYAFFGDSTHTGNEKCASQGNPNCTAVFGPGVLSLVFGWNNFDSIAFLIQFNQGYAMTLPEIANSFYDLDDPKNNDHSDGSTQMTTIKCNNKKGTSNAFGSWEGDDPSKCNHPTFQLNRPMITLPNINHTADQIYNRIIPNPGGDCKLVNDAANSLNIPEYNMTITGQPVAIACNVSAAEQIDGTVIPLTPIGNQTVIPLTPITNQTVAAVSSGNTSTDGQNGHQIAVPPPTPFQPLLNSTNAVCLSGSGGTLCVPNGQYDIQRGSLGFDSSKINSLTMPAGASMSWSEAGQEMPHGVGSGATLQSFSLNQTATNTNFAAAMARAPKAGPNGGGARWNASLPGIPDPPVVCLFTETDHNGDVVCFGSGGGNVTGGIAGRSSSVAVHGNATAEIFAQFYGDAGSATVTSDILDLSQEVYGTAGSFNQKVVAMRVCQGTCDVT